MKVPRAGEASTRVEFITRTESPAPDMAAIQSDEVIHTCWAVLEDVGATYWGTAQVDDRATHFLKVRRNPHVEACLFAHGVLVRTTLDSRLFRIARVASPPEYKGMWWRLELVELGQDAPEGSDLVEDAISG